jgi:hypothetical protein
MKPLCYISSPGGFIESNLEFHRMIYHRLLQDGHVTPIAPLLPMMIPDIQGWFPERKWIDYDLEILWHCDVMLMVSATPEALKNSNGCKEELDFCFDNNIHVMTSVRALYKWLETDWYDIPPTSENQDEYFSATMRHLIAGDYAAVACNAMILWHLSREEKKQ